MANLPGPGYMTDNARTEAQLKTSLEDQRTVIAELLGGSDEETYTIATGTIVPSVASMRVANEGAASSDSLDNISTTNMPVGRFIMLRPDSGAGTLTLSHAAGGSGEIIISTGSNWTLTDVNERALLQNIGDKWQLVLVTGGDGFLLSSKSALAGSTMLVYTAGLPTFAVPASAGRLLIEAVGGGGSGASGGASIPGGGGGAGGYGRWLVDVSAGGTINMNIGNGGLAAAGGGNNGLDGNPTTVTFDGTGDVMTVPGGKGGLATGQGAPMSVIAGGQPGTSVFVSNGAVGGHGSILGANEFGGPGGAAQSGGSAQTQLAAAGDDGQNGGGGAGGSVGQLGGEGGDGYVLIHL